MHHALEIEEILRNIFHYSSQPGPMTLSSNKTDLDLSTLARTCRVFKEPALDALWSALYDLTPLARCLPEASYQLYQEYTYSFKRPLVQTEWDILQSYTRRVRSIRDFEPRGLDQKSFAILSNLPTPGPLFPNLRYLHCSYSHFTMSLLHLPLPSLVFLEVHFGDKDLFQRSLKELFPSSSPNLRRLFISVGCEEDTFMNISLNYMSRWQNICTLVCPQVTLDADALVHLSCMTSLTRLEFTLNATLLVSTSLPIFSNLHKLLLHSSSLGPISQLFYQARFPAITELIALIKNSPFRQDLTSFFAYLPISNTSHTIRTLHLEQSIFYSRNVLRSYCPLLRSKDLQPCLAFGDLRTFNLDIEWNVDLSDAEVLAIASAWPKLEHFLLNSRFGWNFPGGVTPGGLVQLLQTCRSLNWVTLRLDTRGYTEVFPSQMPSSLGLTLSSLYINVVDSVIEVESVTAIATLFSELATYSKSNFAFSSWAAERMLDFRDSRVYKKRWDDVRRLVHDALKGCREVDDSDTSSDDG